jgi:hypothetical protein
MNQDLNSPSERADLLPPDSTQIPAASTQLKGSEALPSVPSVVAPASIPWSIIGAIIFFSVVLSFAASIVADRFLPGFMGGGQVVTFDAIRFTNAQRQVASKFMLKGAPSDAAGVDNAILLNQSSRVEAVVREVAGAGTIVLVKQAVVDSQYHDITDEVLTRLGLPTNVPGVLYDMSEFGSAPAGLRAPESKRDVLP